MSAPNIILPGLPSMPSGYFLGRFDGGFGPMQLIDPATAAGIVSAATQPLGAPVSSGSSGTTDTFTYPAITNSVVTTADGSNVYASTSSMVPAAGSAYNFRAVISGWASGSKSVGLAILDAASASAKGGMVFLGTDGKWYLISLFGGATLAVSAASVINQATPTVIIDFTVAFGSPGHMITPNSAGNLSAIGSSLLSATLTTALFICPLAPTFADIGKIQVQKLS